MSGQQTDPLRIIVQNLAFATTTDELEAAFSGLGKIEDCVMATDAAGKSRGFGFITFASTDAVKKAVAEDAVFELGGRTLRVQVANQKKESSKTRKEVKAFGPKLYCGDLPWELSADELASHFEQYGAVENAYLAEVQYANPVNGYKPHRGFGFVEFSTEEEATKALKASHVIKGVSVRVTSAKGEAKETRRRKERSNGDNDNNAQKKGGNNNNNNASKKNDGKTSEKKEKSSKEASAAPKEKEAAAPKAEPKKAPAPASKKPGVRVPAAPAKNPWGKKAAEQPAVSADEKDYPSLADVASGKVKAHVKTEDEIAAEIAAEREAEKRAKGGKGKEEVAGKGKEEAE